MDPITFLIVYVSLLVVAIAGFIAYQKWREK